MKSFCFKWGAHTEVKDARQMSALVLAYVGDAVFDLFIRTYLAVGTNRSANKLHLDATNFVKASAQAEIAKKIYDDFTEEEKNIFRRGRNAKTPTIPKNADISDYHYATAFETVIGYLFLCNKLDRLEEILLKSIINGSES